MLTKQEQLYDKCTAELDAFVDDLKTKPIDEILVLAYEKVAREEITEALNSDDFLSAEEAEALLALDNPLEVLYNDWLDTEEFHGDIIRESIGITAARVKDDAELHADKEAVQVKAKEKTPSTQAINGEIACYDVVVSTGNSDYPFLVGEVNAVDKLGSDEHNSGNLTDDVFVDFSSEEYSAGRIKEIEEHFSRLYGEPKQFDDIPLYNVIMSPECLIRVKESEIQPLLESRENAEAYCNAALNRVSDLETMLTSIVEKSVSQTPSAVKREKSSFDKAISRGKDKSETYKSQKSGELAADKKKHEERS